MSRHVKIHLPALLVTTFLLGSAGVSEAAGQGLRQRGPNAGVENLIRLTDELGLSEEQRSQLEAIRQESLSEGIEQATRMLELRSDIAAGLREPEAMRSEMRAFRERAQERAEERRAQLEEILTEQQSEAVRQLRRQRGERGIRRGGGSRHFDDRPRGRSFRSEPRRRNRSGRGGDRGGPIRSDTP